jgi:hypothetical protein
MPSWSCPRCPIAGPRSPGPSSGAGSSCMLERRTGWNRAEFTGRREGGQSSNGEIRNLPVSRLPVV